MIEKSEELGDAASDIVRDTVKTLQELGVEQDFAAYLMLCAGLGLAIMGNRNSPIIVNQLLASAMMVANQNIIDMEEKDDNRTKYH